MFDMGAKNVLEKILPVVDNFERGLATPIVDEADQPFADGMQMIYKQLMKQLEDLGVKPIEAIGKEFDPNFHNAVMHVEDENLLKLTGGIVQGLSGSPILQNGRLIGAVTHVFVNDPAKGYGIFVEEMTANKIGQKT